MSGWGWPEYFMALVYVAQLLALVGLAAELYLRGEARWEQKREADEWDWPNAKRRAEQAMTPRKERTK